MKIQVTQEDIDKSLATYPVTRDATRDCLVGTAIQRMFPNSKNICCGAREAMIDGKHYLLPIEITHEIHHWCLVACGESEANRLRPFEFEAQFNPPGPSSPE